MNQIKSEASLKNYFNWKPFSSFNWDGWIKKGICKNKNPSSSFYIN